MSPFFPSEENMAHVVQCSSVAPEHPSCRCPHFVQSPRPASGLACGLFLAKRICWAGPVLVPNRHKLTAARQLLLLAPTESVFTYKVQLPVKRPTRQVENPRQAGGGRCHTCERISHLRLSSHSRCRVEWRQVLANGRTVSKEMALF